MFPIRVFLWRNGLFSIILDKAIGKLGTLEKEGGVQGGGSSSSSSRDVSIYSWGFGRRGRRRRGAREGYWFEHHWRRSHFRIQRARV